MTGLATVTGEGGVEEVQKTLPFTPIIDKHLLITEQCSA